jgi:DNA-binding transcriptional LysR family regulator
MEDLNDIYFFASVVQHGGFSAAARKIGVEKTRLSRRIAALEKRLGVRLLQRTTRALALTEAGQRFFERCIATVDGAQAAYDSVAELRREPAGLVRLSSPALLAQRCLAHVLPAYMTTHPKVSVFVEATDRTVNVIEERFDIAIRALPRIEDVAGLVAKTLGHSQRVLVVSPAFLERHGRPEDPDGRGSGVSIDPRESAGLLRHFSRRRPRYVCAYLWVRTSPFCAFLPSG